MITQTLLLLHSDVCPENILYSKGKATVHDYGCSAKLENGTFLDKLKGSHIPPEAITAYQKNVTGTYGFYSDIYGLGMTFYELLYGDYFDHSIDNTLQDFAERYRKYHVSVVNFLSKKMIRYHK